MRGARRMRVIEAIVISFAAFTIYFWLPLAFPCRVCKPGMTCIGVTSHDSGGSSSTGSDISGSTGGRRLSGGGSSVTLLQHHCPVDHFSAMGSLLLSGQEGVIKHLFRRSEETEYSFDTIVLLTMLVVYFAIAVLTFGLQVAAGRLHYELLDQ